MPHLVLCPIQQKDMKNKKRTEPKSSLWIKSEKVASLSLSLSRPVCRTVHYISLAIAVVTALLPEDRPTNTDDDERVEEQRRGGRRKVLLDFFITWYSRWENVECPSQNNILFLFRTQGALRHQHFSESIWMLRCCCRVFYFHFTLFYSHSLSKK